MGRPSKYPVHVKTQAFEQFVTTGLSLADIATGLDINVGTIRFWSSQEKWNQQRKALAKQLRSESEKRIGKLLEAAATGMIHRQLAICRRLDAKILRKLNTKDELSVDELRQITRAAQSASAIREKLMEPVKKPTPAGETNKPDGPQLSVHVGFTPSSVPDNATAAQQIPAAEIEVGAPDYDVELPPEPDPQSESGEDYTRTDPDCPF